MALIRWQPFHEMDSLQRDMNRMFEALASDNQGSMRQSFMPLAEMEQTEDAVNLRVEVPGINANDLDVQVTREAVMISGERKTKSKSKNNGMTRSEFRYGSFQRTIPLPIPVDNERVKGDYQDGILTLELPKLQKQENKVTKVNISSNSNRQNISGKADNSGLLGNSNSQGSAATTSAQESSNTDGSENPSTKSVDVNTTTGGYGNQDVWEDGQANSEQSVVS